MALSRLVLAFSVLALPALAQQPTAASFPPGLVARATALTAMCRAAGGQPVNGDRAFVYNQYDLTGDGRPDFLMDEAGFACSNKAVTQVTPQGAAVQIFDGATGASVFRGLAFTFQVTADRQPRVMMTLRGVVCSPNALATTTCQRPLVWNAQTRTFTGAPQLADAGGAIDPLAGLPAPGAGRPAAPSPAPAPASAMATAAPAPKGASLTLTDADKAAAFKAAGFKQVGREWRACEGFPKDMPYGAGAIESVLDLNNDGRPEVVITEHSSFCHGGEGEWFGIVTKGANGAWTRIAGEDGMFDSLTTRANGWQEIRVGGPGFTHPVLRYNGKEYVFNRQQKE